MPQNIEIKAKVADLEALKAKVELIADVPMQILQQEDIFFPIPKGRLKLRILSPDNGKLIFYDRQDTAGPKLSNFTITPIQDPQSLRETLSQALGILGILKKTRWLYMIGQTRVHLDRVDDLGDFMELEVCLRENQTPADGQHVAKELMQKLDVTESNLIDCAYIDLLTK
ncbi:CYTH domain-containing protein [bacterium]|nr:CYTH domain-containing protein [bacterium]